MSDKINVNDVIAANAPMELQRKYVRRERTFAFNNQSFDSVKGIFVNMIAKANKDLGAHGNPVFTGSLVMHYHTLETNEEFEQRKSENEKEIRKELYLRLKEEFEPTPAICEDCHTMCTKCLNDRKEAS